MAAQCNAAKDYVQHGCNMPQVTLLSEGQRGRLADTLSVRHVLKFLVVFNGLRDVFSECFFLTMKNMVSKATPGSALQLGFCSLT